MADEVHLAFERHIAVLPLTAILPGRIVPEAAMRTVEI